MRLIQYLDQIYELFNESKKLFFAYNCDWREYIM